MPGPTRDSTQPITALSGPETDPVALPDVSDAVRAAMLDALIQPGRRIGEYRVLGLIGRGGMGVVLLAEQLQPVERQVALKLMAGRRMDARALAFFEVERQLLARMQHPAIAQIFDAGTTAEGIPFFSMELVEGDPLTRFADQERLSFHERLELFRRICLGVHHAHSRGIVHRDLKPANILVSRVDGEPVPKIIDFGIASLSSRADDSRVPVAGTAAYMSPEQINRSGGELEPRSDVYSLGVVLFELLTGERPFTTTGNDTAPTLRTPFAAVRAKGQDHLRRKARAQRLDPVRLQRLLKGDVAAVMLKAIATVPEQRYQSAAALADDLEALIEHFPVSAVKRTIPYVWARFWRRHRLSLSLVMVAGLALILGLVMVLISWRNSTEARDRALAEAETSRAVSEFFGNRMWTDNPAFQCDVEARTTLGASARRAASELEEIYARQPLARVRIRVLLSDALLVAGLSGEAMTQIERARREIQAATGKKSRESLEIELEYGTNLSWLERFADARMVIEQTAQEASQRFGELDPLVLEAQIELASLMLLTDQIEGARELSQRILPIAKARRGSDGGALYSGAIGTLAEAHRLLGDFDAAARLLRADVSSSRRRYGSESDQTLTALTNLALLEYSRERYDEARKILETEVAPAYRKVCGEQDLPSSVERYLGMLENQKEDYAAALPHLQAADRQQRSQNQGEELMSNAFIWIDLGQALIGVDRADEAIPMLLAADRILARDLPESDADRQNVFSQLAWAYEELEQPEEQARWNAKVVVDESEDAADPQ